MADSDEDGAMSIVPYNQNREVVLRHNEAVVVYDRTSRQLELQTVGQTEPEILQSTLCPYCRRPWLEEHESEPGEEMRRASTPSGYVDPNYFAMLDSNQSPPGSRPASSHNQLTPFVVDEGDEGREPATPLTAAGISPQSFNDGFFKRNFTEERVLGRGGKGIVMLVKHVLGNNDLGHFACKRVPVGDSTEWLQKVLVEVQTLKTLSHHNLAPYHHAWLEHAKVNNFGPTVPCVFILQRYCEAGDLHRYVCGSAQTEYSPQELKARMRRKSKGEPEPPSSLGGPRRLSIEMIYSFFKDINNGLRYLHKRNLIHRDLKPSNCLLTMETNKLRAVVSDFGEVQSEDAVRASTGSTGTVSYCAPEVLRRVAPQGPFGNFTHKSDIFSLGMILYFLCFSSSPYLNADILNEDNEDLDQLRAEICQWPGFQDTQRLRPELPDKVYWLLGRLLSVNPDQRPTSKEIWELMKKRNHWDIPTDERRPSLGPAIDRPSISAVSSGRPESAATVRPGDSMSPQDDRGYSTRSPEVEGLTDVSSTSGRDYGTLSRGSSYSPAPGATEHSLVLSRRVNVKPAGTPTRTGRHHSNHLHEYGSPQPARGQPHSRPYDLPDDRFYEYTDEDDDADETSPGALRRYRLGYRSQEGLMAKYDARYASGREETVRHPPRLPPGDQQIDGHAASRGNDRDLPNFFSRRFLVSPDNRASSSVLSARPVVADLVAFAMFMLKIFSITVPCSPHAAQPWLFYPLLVLGTLDFGLQSWPFHVFALLCHVLAVVVAAARDILCVEA